ncbi:MAG TPA: diaminopimelate epimerase [Nocardioidaceae bacterium]|nr:diaminopimelate epimerase [Nocardioidaceae bacterium]
MGIGFLKGHGTENDFVLIPDDDGGCDLDAAAVAAVCDRRAGIGGDGLIRVVRTGACDDPAAVAARERAEWFMDYRNADGSLAEMCGNGVRVFARYLADHDLVDPARPLPVATRTGVVEVRFADDPSGPITADMGVPQVVGETAVAVAGSAADPLSGTATDVAQQAHTWPALHVSMGNPHAVTFVDALAEAGSLREAPAYDTEAFPTGVNVEFVVRRGPRHLAMRVHERGSGETRSCGTGACAAMVAAAVTDPEDPVPADGPDTDRTYRVDVPGGTLQVTWTRRNHVLLAGPAVLVARGEVANSLADGARAVRASNRAEALRPEQLRHP